MGRFKLLYPHFIKKLTLVTDFVFYFIFRFLSREVKKINRNKILLVGEYLPYRIIRMTESLSKMGYEYEFHLMISNWGRHSYFNSKSIFNKQYFRNKWHLKLLVRRSADAAIIHAFEPKAYYQYIACSEINRPYIYDFQDLLSSYYGLNPPHKWQKANLPFEKLMVQGANAILAYSMELQAAKKVFGIKPRKVVFFPFYCRIGNMVPAQIAYNSGRCKLIYIGSVDGLSNSGPSNFKEFIDAIGPSSVDFHIYPSPESDKVHYLEYKQLEKKWTNFNMNHTLPPNELQGVLVKFNFGVVPFADDNADKYLYKYEYASTLKLFSYLESGLPVVVPNNWKFIKWVVERYQIGVAFQLSDLANIGQEISDEKNNILRTNVSNFVKNNSLDDKISVINRLYQELISEIDSDK